MARRIIDWNKWRLLYVRGGDDVTLDTLASIPDAPSLHSLKKRSAAEMWRDQRVHFRQQAYALARDGYALERASSQVGLIINSTEMLIRHLHYAQQMQEIAIQKLKSMDASKLSVRDAIELMKLGIEIERLGEGLATERYAADLSSMSEKELEVIAYGKVSV